MIFLKYNVIMLLLVTGGWAVEIFAINVENQMWRHQLDLIKERNQSINDSTKVGMDIPQLLNYKYLDEIKTVNDLSRIKKVLLTDNSYLPLSISGVIKVVTFKELRSIKGENDFSDIHSNMQQLLDNTIHIGYSKVELTWKYHSLMFKTICIVSDNGIIYDNIITNIMPISQVEEQSGPI